ncbi:TniQ family protein, partial [Aerococcus urinae]|uniref:TniQ family protein n=1 Tax=Aerococcus urinae TaxID=1376 RepID=UPI0015EBA697
VIRPPHPDLQRLVVPVSPIPGESLTGLLARAAHQNFVSRAEHLLSHAGIVKGTLGSVATCHATQRKELAALIGVAADEIEPLFYSKAERRGGYGAEIEIRGIRLSLRCREGRHRRVAPASLRLSPHHRLLWEFRFIHWCAETYQYLVDRCGACGRQLGWNKYGGIQFCERCGADLREQDVEYVDEQFRDIAKALSGLVDCADGSRKFRSGLHEDLIGLNEFDLLKLVLILASDFAWNPREVHLALCDSSRATAPSLETWARGLDRLHRWPEDIDRYLSKYIDTKEIDCGYGMLLKIGNLVHHINPADADLPTVLRKAIADFYRQNRIVQLRPIGEKKDWYRSGWVTASEAKAKFSVTDWVMEQALKCPDVNKMSHGAGKRAPTLILEDDLRRWLDRFRQAIDVLGAGALIGIPEFAVWELVESGHIAILVSEERVRTPRVGCLDTSSVLKLRDDILERAQIAPDDLSEMEPLADAIRNSPFAIPPWSKS